ncbi:chaperone modulator CbpM [Siccirubricoccus sp. KC 17139]|uniref:Chaperone modulator CbpM n=1 Tax=Siccirubricoccus soli TaxID=2899147 RepID=A0ABT1D2T0_9PROT|nr:chaperone modulator CbpM [Siccirubricoccus soli]MCO6416233.1 chaperone modulator CbpM [Siccirubricoccus soli]MCP2682367.1 chaperone modulator CbpM [Siccirubricoccus soli]
MIGLAELLAQVPAVPEAEVTLWIERRWLRAEQAPGGGWVFTEMDVARCRLLAELRITLELEEEVMPLVLSLLDQLYDARRTVKALLAALDQQPDEVRQAVLAAARRETG